MGNLRMRLGRLAAALVVSAAVSACGGTPAARPEPALTPAAPAAAQQPAPAPSAEPAPAQANQPDLPPVAAECFQILDAYGYGNLVDLARLWGEYKLMGSIGQAEEVFRREAMAEAAGWPIVNTNRWATEAWSKLDVQQLSKDQFDFVLHHTDGRVQDVTHLLLTCDGHGNWVWEKIGDEHRWYSLAPDKLDGQDGALTEALAQQLISFMSDRYGTFAMRVAATGRELERGRKVAILDAAGAPVQEPEFIAKGRLKLEPRSADEVVGTWFDDKGAPLGQQVLFKRDGGLWKVADHTENGQWAPADPVGYTGPPPVHFDRHLLGLHLGMTVDEVKGIVMEKPKVNGNVHTYPVRNFTVEYDSKGRVIRIATEIGITARGLHVGVSPEAIVAAYGPPKSRAPGRLVYSDGLVALRFDLVTQDGHEILRRIVMEYER